jgi:hypothetical protein
MSYGQYRNTGVRVLHTYADALNKFENTKPIRGRTDITAPMYPLGHRHRVDSFWITKCLLTQDVECCLYRTPVVTYQSNGNIKIKCDGWSTISTANFIGEVLGISSYIFDHNLCVAIHNENGTQHFRIPADNSITLRRENGRFVYVDGSVTNVTHKVNRKAINSARKQYADFKNYVRSMIKLRGCEFSREEMEAVGITSNYHSGLGQINGYSWNHEKFKTTTTQVAAWMSATHEDKHNDYYKAMMVFASSFGWGTNLDQARFDAGFNYFTLGLHRNEVLDEEVLPLGTIKKDSYGKYWRRAWGKYHAGS